MKKWVKILFGAMLVVVLTGRNKGLEITVDNIASIEEKVLQVNKCEQRDYSLLPSKFSYEEEGRIGSVKSQGNIGTCWAFASLTALESTLLPEEELDLSEDHMSRRHSFQIEQEEGGDYSMSMAYLAAWQGPVLEDDDPYGDGKSPQKLEAVKHVQEVQIIASKNYDEIKYMLYHYGGVQSSLYTSMTDVNSETKHYNKENAAYCYKGKKASNHDIVIIGWDDNFPKEKFNGNVKTDGAFICRNSWGENFGDNGNFYVSYEDVNIGKYNVVYTVVEEADNYDNIYQTDNCGWVGSLGYERLENKYVYFSNIYKAKSDEVLKAVSFYATGEKTEFKVYVVTGYEKKSDLSKREKVAEGIVHNSGYYTIELEESVYLKQDEKYGIIIAIYTPDSTKPIAVEYANDDITSNVSLKGKQGYFSIDGEQWVSAEKTEKCNICLKAFTDNADEFTSK